MTVTPAWLNKPKHKKNVISTNRGWVVEDTGELLVSVRNMDKKIAEYLGQPVEVKEEKVEDVVVDVPTLDIIKDEPKGESEDTTDANEAKDETSEITSTDEDKQDEEVKDEAVTEESVDTETVSEEVKEEPVKEEVVEQPKKKRGRKPKNAEQTNS